MESSEDDVDPEDELLPQAFPVDDLPNFDPTVPPTSGVEFLRYVRYNILLFPLLVYYFGQNIWRACPKISLVDMKHDFVQISWWRNTSIRVFFNRLPSHTHQRPRLNITPHIDYDESHKTIYMYSFTCVITHVQSPNWLNPSSVLDIQNDLPETPDMLLPSAVWQREVVAVFSTVRQVCCLSAQHPSLWNC